VWIAAGIALARPRGANATPLPIALAVAAGLAGLLTVVQVATGSDTLALLFPWRLSVVLMPVATTILLSRLVQALPAWCEGRAARVAAGLVVLVLAAGGVWISVRGLGFQSGGGQELIEFARQTGEPGDVYFLPITVPDLAKTTRGSLSSDFKPIDDKRRDKRVIPPDLQRFRLAAGVPIFIDFKSIPYKDVEVIEWWDRLRCAQDVQARLAKGEQATALEMLRERGITHLVVPAGQTVRGAELVHEDGHYRVYRLGARQ
jgi:hypothetical protein